MEITRLIMVAVGGQGNLLASKVLGEAALLSKIEMRMSEIHGMAQRGGVVESAMVFGKARSPIISDGEADILLGFEPSETLRALNRCNKGTTVITNTSPLPPFTAAIGRGVYPEIADIKAQISSRVDRFIAFDAMELAKAAGSSLTMNVVLLGALAGTKALALSKESMEAAIKIRTKPAFLEMNLKAFGLGFSAGSSDLAD